MATHVIQVKGRDMSVDYKNLVIEELNYNSYLHVKELLSLQNQVSKGPHHDEMFFIIIHQSAELWFKEILHETGILVEALKEGVVSRAMKVVKRISAILNLQVQQIRLLSTLTPVEFAGFREYLRPASGFQSAQYRMMEFTYGIREPFFIKFFEKDLPEVVTKLQEIQKKQSVYDLLLEGLSKQGIAIPTSILKRDVTKTWELDNELVQILKELYENPGERYHYVLLLEAMLDLDEALVLWRKTHAAMVARTIGNKTGTGGSAGFNFLKSREDIKAFPELWEVRNVIGGKQ